MNERWTAHAFYQQAEIHRLRGEFTAAEKAYREASRCGSEPQPPRDQPDDQLTDGSSLPL